MVESGMLCFAIVDVFGLESGQRPKVFDE